MSDGSRADARPAAARDVPLAALWFALLGGPIAWTAHLLASYPLVPHACDTGSTTLLNIVTAVTAVIAAAAAATGWWAYRRGRRAGAPDGPGGGDASESRVGFMALTGMLVALLFTFAILIEGLPPLLVDPCTSGM